MVLIPFLAGVFTTAILAGATVLLLVKLDLLRRHSVEEELKARLETCLTLTEGRCKASEERWAKEFEDCRGGVLNLSGAVEKLMHQVNSVDRLEGEVIPSGMEVIGAVEGVGGD